MAGILSFGAYVPPTRLPLAALGGGQAAAGGPERAVAWADEDALTMAVAAGVECVRGFARDGVDAVLLATTTSPFAEKQGAALVARALDLRRDVRTADMTGSLRAGIDALAAAADAVDAGSARRVLVLASDCRTGAPGSGAERSGGDGAAAFLVGEGEGVARTEGAFAVADEIVDVWRMAGDPFVHAWEERFVVQEGYVPRTVEALRGLLERHGLRPQDVQRAPFYAPDARSHAAVARALRIDPGAAQEPLFGRLGSAGCAFAPLLLAAALESARPGERVAVAGYGDGASALLLRTTEQLEKLEPRRGVAWHLGRRRAVASYDVYLRARGLAPAEYPAPADAGLSATVHFRERDEDVSLKGQRCIACGGVQFPVQRICERCFAKDRFEAFRLSDRTGRVVTWTLDHFFPTPEPPTLVTVVEVEGARLHLQLVNAAPEDLRLGLPVEFVFRCMHRVGGRPNYYWKATPAPEGTPAGGAA